MSSSQKNWPVKGRLVFICLRVWGPEPLTPPPLHTVQYTCSILIHLGKGGGGSVEPERRLEGQQFTKLGRKYQHDWLYLQFKNSNKHTCCKIPLQVNYFRWRHFALVSIYLISPWFYRTPPAKPLIVPSGTLRGFSSAQNQNNQPAQVFK